MTVTTAPESAPLMIARRARTLAEFLNQLGDVSPARVRMQPTPGLATVSDLIDNNDVRRDIHCELIDGVLVEKAGMSYLENRITTILAFYLQLFLRQSRLGAGFTEGAIYKMSGGNFRLPDFTVCLKEKFPTGKIKRVPYADFAPDLAVEVLSESNTVREIADKRKELFASGTQLIWVVDPKTRTVDVYVENELRQTLSEVDTLTGGDVLPGFELSIADWFREAEEV